MSVPARCYWLTGLPASGKTTLAHAWVQDLASRGVHAYVLDGDVLRQGLCAGLGLDREGRRENVRRAGEAARLLMDSGVTPVCALVSPFAQDRLEVRALFEPGRFLEIHLSTDVHECAARDPKGLYARARKGELTGLTGWDAPYEIPESPDLRVDTAGRSLEASLTLLRRLG